MKVNKRIKRELEHDIMITLLVVSAIIVVAVVGQHLVQNWSTSMSMIQEVIR